MQSRCIPKFNLSDSNDVSNLIKSTENKIKNDEELKEKLALDIINSNINQ